MINAHEAIIGHPFGAEIKRLESLRMRGLATGTLAGINLYVACDGSKAMRALVKAAEAEAIQTQATRERDAQRATDAFARTHRTPEQVTADEQDRIRREHDAMLAECRAREQRVPVGDK